MSYRRRLFLHRKPYDQDNTRSLFLQAVKENVLQHQTCCESYAAILRAQKFDLDSLRSEDDLHRIPVIPTLYLKRNRMMSIPEDKMLFKATSSGTQGQHSVIGFDWQSLYYGIRMMLNFFGYHHVISLMPTNYIVLGYEPSNHTQMGAVKTAYHTTRFAPALHREFALKDTGGDYAVNIDGIQQALTRYAKQPFPVRFVGFPSYMYFLVKVLKENKIRLSLNKHSKVMMGGGWKQFSNQQIDSNEFYQLVEETLGIPQQNCLEFFSAVEHPLPYCKCANGHFHVPIYSRVIIRDVHTLDPVEYGQTGLLSFVSPLMNSVPLTSVMTDDLAVMHDGASCGCGITTPYFEVLGRAGVQQIKTCTTGAAELMRGVAR